MTAQKAATTHYTPADVFHATGITVPKQNQWYDRLTIVPSRLDTKPNGSGVYRMVCAAIPITSEDLEAREDQWLNSGGDGADKYGFNSFFVYKYYSDDEKAALFKERGEKRLYRWQPGMRKPKAI